MIVSVEKTTWYRTKAFNLALGLLVTAGCLTWAFYVMKGEESPAAVWRQMALAFSTADYWTLPAYWVCLYLFFWLKAWRWRLLLAPMGEYRTMRDLFPPVLIGFAFNNLLPAHLGEFVRVYVFSRQHRKPMTAILSSVVLERIFDMIAILVFLGLGLWFSRDQMQLDEMDPRIQIGIYVFVAGVCLGLAAAFAYLVWTRQFVAIVEWCVNHVRIIPERLRDRLTAMLEAGAQGLASLHSGSLLTSIFINSMLQWFLDGLMIHLALVSFGIEVSFWVSAVVLGISAIGVTVPASPGYFGVVQICFLVALKPYVNDNVAVFSASIYFHVAQWVPVTLIGLFFFMRSGLKVADVRQARQAEFR